MSRIDQALAQIKIARELRESPIIDATLSRIFFLARQYDNAVDAAKHAINRYRQSFLGYIHLGIVYRKLDRLPEAIEQFQTARQLGSTPEWGNPATLGELGYTLALSREPAAAKKVIKELEAMSERQYVSPMHFAKINMGLGNLSRAFEYLEQTYRDRSAWLLTLRRDPLFDDIREHPQFQDLLRRIGLP